MKLLTFVLTVRLNASQVNHRILTYEGLRSKARGLQGLTLDGLVQISNVQILHIALFCQLTIFGFSPEEEFFPAEWRSRQGKERHSKVSDFEYCTCWTKPLLPT